MKLTFNNMEIEGTPEECASFKKLMETQPATKFTPITQPNTQPYISPYTYPYPSTTAPSTPFWEINKIISNGQINQGSFTCSTGTNSYVMIN